MKIAITIIYAVAAVVSSWGVVGPWLSARRDLAKSLRAKARLADLDKAVDDAAATGDDLASGTARQRREKELRAPFEGGPLSLMGWTQAVMFGGGTGASRAAGSYRDRKNGLGWVVAGVVLGSVASILALWVLPS